MLFVAPRVVLVNQQAAYIEEQTSLSTIAVSSENSEDEIYNRIQRRTDVDVVVATPQAMVERFKTGRLRIERFSCIIIDEAHHAKAKHPYMDLLQQWREVAPPHSRPFILGLSASPSGSDQSYEIHTDIATLCSNLGNAVVLNPQHFVDIVAAQPRFERASVTKPDADLRLERLILSSASRMHPSLRDLCLSDVLSPHFGQLSKRLHFPESQLFKRDILTRLRRLLLCLRDIGSSAIIAELRALLTPLEHIDPIFSDLVRSLDSINVEAHPRLELLRKLISQTLSNSTSPRALIFVRHRLSASLLNDAIQTYLPSITSAVVTGRHRDGTVDEERETILDRFKSGDINVIIATSVLEEGIDIPACNLVVRLSSTQDLKSLLQSRGRARSNDASTRCVIEDRTTSLALLFAPELAEQSIIRVLREMSVRNAQISALLVLIELTLMNLIRNP